MGGYFVKCYPHHYFQPYSVCSFHNSLFTVFSGILVFTHHEVSIASDQPNTFCVYLAIKYTEGCKTNDSYFVVVPHYIPCPSLLHNQSFVVESQQRKPKTESTSDLVSSPLQSCDLLPTKYHWRIVIRFDESWLSYIPTRHIFHPMMVVHIKAGICVEWPRLLLFMKPMFETFKLWSTYTRFKENPGSMHN